MVVIPAKAGTQARVLVWLRGDLSDGKKLPGCARVTFFVGPKKVTKERARSLLVASHFDARRPGICSS